MKVKVISVFRDKFTGKYYTPGEVIEVGEEARVLDMESRRLAERKTLIDALKSIGAQASGNMKEETLLAKVSELDEESTAKLKEALGIE